jgi:predicted transcriptional regulator
MGRWKATLDPTIEVKTPIGQVLRKIMQEKHMSVKTLIARSGYQRANIYRTFKREVMEDTEIDMWASFLDVNPDVVFKRWTGAELPAESTFTYTRANLTHQLEQKSGEIEDLKNVLKLKDAQIDILKQLLVGSGKGTDLVNTITPAVKVA